MTAPSPVRELKPSVVYRTGAPTAADYDEAIEALQAAKRQLDGDKLGCMICADSGHDAAQCHHNPLLLARQWAQATAIYVCYHCGFVATNDEEGLAHFGADDTHALACAHPDRGPA